jgi:hypothetical protein
VTFFVAMTIHPLYGFARETSFRILHAAYHPAITNSLGPSKPSRAATEPIDGADVRPRVISDLGVVVRMSANRQTDTTAREPEAQEAPDFITLMHLNDGGP